MKKKSLLEGQSETILNLVNAIYQKGDFTSFNGEEVETNEIVIGELFDYEKAIVIAAGQIQKRHNNLIEEEIETEEDGDYVQNFLDKSIHEAYSALLWSSIRHRLGTLAFKNENIGIRKNWKIVAVPEKDNHKDCASCPMAPVCPDAE